MDINLCACGECRRKQHFFPARLHGCWTCPFPPDIVLTDIRLKSSSGLDLIKSLRGRLPALRIVATTMFDVRHIERLTRAADASGFVSKGDGPDKLIALIREVLKDSERDENS